MYQIGTPIAGGLVGVGALAHTGLDTLGIAITAITLTMSGLLLMRMRLIRRRRAAESD